jgi:hypothetical protein
MAVQKQYHEKQLQTSHLLHLLRVADPIYCNWNILLIQNIFLAEILYIAPMLLLESKKTNWMCKYKTDLKISDLQ